MGYGALDAVITPALGTILPGSALLLNGMGQDGAEGMAVLKSAHWNTIAESPQSCVAFGMPKSAIERGAAKHILPLETISLYLVRMLTHSPYYLKMGILAYSYSFVGDINTPTNIVHFCL